MTEALEAFADNTMRYLRDEGRLLAEGIDFPPLETRFRDRHALVVARGPGHKRDLRDRPAVHPRLQAGARRRRRRRRRAARGRATSRDVIVGDMDSVSDGALRSGAEIVVHAYADGDAPGRAAARARSGVAVPRRPAPGISEDVALLLAYEKGAELIVAVGHALQPDRVPRAEPRRHVVDVRDAAEGGGDPRRREGRLAARQPPGRALAARPASRSRASARSSSRSSPRRRCGT